MCADVGFNWVSQEMNNGQYFTTSALKLIKFYKKAMNSPKAGSEEA